MLFGKSEEEAEMSFNEFENDMQSIVAIRKTEEDLARYFTRSKDVIKHMGELLDGKTISSRNEIRMAKLRELEPMSKKKDALLDVSNSDVRKSWIDRATSYVKTKYRELKEKFRGPKEEER